MQVLAKNFHPMRGHVDDGITVIFQDGSMLTVRPSGVGWALFNKLGDRVTEATNDAYVLTRQIVEMEAQTPTADHAQGVQPGERGEG